MDALEKENQDRITNDEEIRYAQIAENRSYSKIPTNWLKIFLERSEKDLTGREQPISDVLTHRIEEIKEEIAKRSS
jgi:hypothetical protein